MSYRVSHEWKIGVRLPTGAALATCVHCGVLRSETEEGTTFLRPVKREDERVRKAEPPCVDLPSNAKTRRARRVDRLGCELGAEARAEALAEALERAGDEG